MEILKYMLIAIALVACAPHGENSPPNSASDSSDSFGSPSQALTPDPDTGTYAPGEILVRFNKQTPKKTINAVCSNLKLEIIKQLQLPGLYLMRIKTDASVKSLIDQLKNYPSVRYAEPNYLLSGNGPGMEK